MSAPATPTGPPRVGAEVVTLNGNIDGHFPGRGEQSRPPRACVTSGVHRRRQRGGRSRTPRRRDRRRGFAFGIGHDGDSDRIVIIDADGDVVHEDTVLALLAERYTRESDAADPVVVTTPNASGGSTSASARPAGGSNASASGALHEDRGGAGGERSWRRHPRRLRRGAVGSTFTSASVSGSTASHRRP